MISGGRIDQPHLSRYSWTEVQLWGKNAFMHTPGLGVVWGSKHDVFPPNRRAHHAVLPTKTSLHCPIFWCFLLFPQCWFPSFHYFHVLSFLQALVCAFQHGFHPFFWLFPVFYICNGHSRAVHTVTVLYRFIYVSWGHWYLCFQHSLPGFHHGKIAPGGGRGSRGPRCECSGL